MGKLDKGLFTDCQETDQPEGTYRFAKNLMDTSIIGAKENEEGFTDVGIVAPYTIIGLVPTGESFAVFSTDNVNCEIGVYMTGSYTTVYNSSSLNFKTTNPVLGEYEIDFRGHRIVAWIDQLNPPRIVDLDDPASITSINDLLLFSRSIAPDSSFTVNNSGGTLPTGAYFTITRYIDVNGNTTPWYVQPRPMYINEDSSGVSADQNDGAPANTGSPKSISLHFTGVDTSYDLLEIGFISTIAGITKAYSIREVSASSTLDFTYTGSETITDLTLDEVLTSPASYSNAKAITQLSSRLVLANLESDDNIDYQAYANQIRLNYTLDLVNATTSSKTNTATGFRAGEVYAFYILLELTSGKTLAYHIPGRPVLGGDTDAVSDATSGLTYKRYQVENRTDMGSYTNMGYWENQGEAYPSNFPVDGEGTPLANQKVRHHRMPTMDYIVNTYYGGNGTVGVSQMPRLGVFVYNVAIPAAIQSRVSRWRIAYAKKEYSNSLVVGQDIAQYGANITAVDPNVRQSTAGNWTTDSNPSGGDGNGFTLCFDKLRSHCLDLFYDKPNVTPTYVHFLYALSTANLNASYGGFGSAGGWLVVRSSGNGYATSAGVVSNFTNSSTTRTNIGSPYRRSVSNFAFVNPSALVQGFVNTFNTEGIITMNIFGASAGTTPPVWPVKTPEFYTYADGTGRLLRTGGSVPQPVDAEPTFLYNMCQILDNVHSDFGSQTLIPTDLSTSDFSVTSLSNIYNGDCFICLQSYVSMAIAGHTDKSPYAAVRAFKWWVGEAKNNWGLRHEGTGLDGKYFPKTDPRQMWTPVLPSPGAFSTSLIVASQSQINQINYNSDYTAKNGFVPAVIVKDPTLFVTKFPTTIIFSTIQNTESLSSWRTFLANDRFTQPRNKGPIYNLQGINNIDLLIHHKYSLFKTRTNLGLTGDTADVTLKSADLFSIDPLEVVSSNEGYGGTQNPFSCKTTKAGYFFVDDLQGKVFLFTDQLQEISSNGLRNFFRDNSKGVLSDNAYTSNGYTAWYDEKYNRIMLSKKQGATSYTASYNAISGNWVSYHDYVPDGVVVTSNNSIYSVKNNRFYTHNTGPRCKFYDVSPYASKLDVVFNPEAYQKKTFSSSEWVTELYDSSGVLQTDQTIDYITFRNLEQCSGRIPVDRLGNVYSFYDQSARSLNRSWFFNNFRDVALSPGFVQNFYTDYALDTSKLDSGMGWYDQRKFIDKYVTTRFEYLNTSGYKFLFLDALINYRLSAR